ncbi:MAG: acyltransferase family protein, partial [Burkholderiaceae bacterium]|nr:acyltransferase family protein [Burkholderiaceae bacterium]
MQILRWLAALWVVLLHTAVDLVVPAAYFPDLPAALRGLVHAGFAGVDVFFAISGAVMAESTSSLGPGAGQSLRFLGLRLARIYAGWWPFFGLYLLAFHAWGWPLDGKDLGASWWLWPLKDFQNYLLPILWSLSFEVYFYGVLSLLLWLKRPHQRLALGLWGLAVGGLTAWNLGHGLNTPAGLASMTLLEHFAGSPLVLEFIGGFLVCDFLRSRPQAPAWPWTVAALGLIALAVAYAALAPLQADGLAHPLHTPERVLFVGSAACALVGCALTWRPPRSALARQLAAWGDASYAI